ncbi:MAG TPA: hypothetical protein VM367_19045 [Pseudonocardia sp.]|nr:hypothetical protein [Pseudonocardia sp.]
MPRPVAGALAVSVALTALSIAVARHTPDPARRGEFARWVDVLGEPTLPTWWTAALLLAAAAGHALAGATARATGRPGAGAWFAAAGLAAAFSLAEVSNLHRRVAQALPGDTWGWLPVAAPVGAAVLAVAAAVDPRARLTLAAGGLLVLAGALGGELLAGLLAGGRGASLVAHLGELTEAVGALLMIVAAARVVRPARDGVTLRLQAVPAPAGPPGEPTRIPTRGAWRVLVAVTAAIGASSLLAVLGAPVLEPAARDLRLFLDVLVEHNLPTWWSVSLLLLAALAHVAAYRGARLAGDPAAAGWLVTAAVLTLLSLDDHSQLHERTERLGRLAAGSTGEGGFPFYWLLPGAVAGLGIVAAVGLLAARVRGRCRLLLLGGVGLLLVCALGLEAVQGRFMAAGDEGLGFVVGYHVEELGENVAALLMLGAALAAVRLERDGRGLLLRYTGGAVTPGAPRGRRPRTGRSVG